MLLRAVFCCLLTLAACSRAGFDPRASSPREGGAPPGDARAHDGSPAPNDAIVPPTDIPTSIDAPLSPDAGWPVVTQWSSVTSPTTEGFNAIWGSSLTNVWAVGLYGLVAHYDGSQWAQVSVPSGELLRDIWGTSASDVFISGDSGHVLHYDGSAWTRMESNTAADLRELWGSGPTDVYVVGSGGIHHYDGSQWLQVHDTGAEWLLGVWGAGPSGPIWAVGNNGTLLRGVGAQWQTQDSGTTLNLRSIWGHSATHVYVVGDSGHALYHWDGTSWQAATLPTGLKNNQYPIHLWGRAASDIYFPGGNGQLLHLGADWTIIDTGETQNLVDIWGQGTTLFIVGQAGLILHGGP